MRDAVAWYIVVQVAGLATWPLVARALAPLADRGWAATKTAGLLGLSWLVWLACMLTPLPFTRVTLLGVVVLVGYFVLFVWTIRKAHGYYMNLARTTPERLMAAPPSVRVGDVVGRDWLTDVVARESAFARNGAPILVVGEAGSGKTTFLLKLTQHLAETGVVPVDVSLRAASLPLSFRTLAQDELVRRIDPVVRTDTDAKRIWRSLSARPVFWKTAAIPTCMRALLSIVCHRVNGRLPGWEA